MAPTSPREPDTQRVTRAKARLRVALDKQAGRVTPDSVVKVAEEGAQDEQD